jgi:hypothetical protein
MTTSAANPSIKAAASGASPFWPGASHLFEDLALARGDGRHARILRNLGRADLLIPDVWGFEPLTPLRGHGTRIPT